MKDTIERASTAAVIGSGFGGLALAIRLQSAGVATTIFEARDMPGGRASVFTDQGYTFDAGPTVITDPDCLAQLWALSGRRMSDDVELLPIDPFYRLCWEDGTRFDYAADQDAIDAQIHAISPQDVAGYRRLLAYSEDLYREGYEKMGTIPFQSFWSMAKVAPTLMRLDGHRSVYSKVSQFIKDDKLRQAFSFHTLLVGGNPFATSSIYALIHALERKGRVWFARGGTGALIAAMVRLFQDLGGSLRLNAPVDRIATEGGRVTGLVVGAAFRPFDSVASNADIMHTYRNLLRGTPRGTGALIAAMVRLFQDLGGTLRLNAPVDRIATEGGRVTGLVVGAAFRPFDSVASNADIMHTYRSLLRGTPRGTAKAKALERMSYSMSLFVVYFGLQAAHPGLQHHMVLFGPRYRALLADIFGTDRLSDDFSLYLHAPSVTDPSMAPPGCSAYYALSPVPHLGTADIDWEKVGPVYRDRILQYLEDRHIPNLRRDMVTVRHFSPRDFRDDLNAHLGSAFSVEPLLTQSAWFRPHNRDDAIPNLYMVGAGTHPGAGIPGVVGSAKATAGLMLEGVGR